MEETTCPITGEKNAFYNEEADFYRYTLNNLCVNYRICKDLEIGDDKKTKLAGKLANFSMDYALKNKITYSKVNADNYPAYDQLINKKILENLEQEPMPTIEKKKILFLDFLINTLEKVISDYKNISNKYCVYWGQDQEDLNNLLAAISYTKKNDIELFIEDFQQSGFLDDSEINHYRVTLEGREFLEENRKNHIIETVKNNSNIRPSTQERISVIEEDYQLNINHERKNHIIETVKNNSNIRPSTQERISVIEEDYQLNIKHRKINNLFGELKKIEVKNFPNASALLLRAFLELSINFYLSEKNLELRSNNISLIGKIQKIIEHIGLTPTEKEPLTAIIANPNNPAHTQILNSYTHNKDHHPDPISIKTAFDNLSILFKKIYSE